jgi:hypothetical protein
MVAVQVAELARQSASASPKKALRSMPVTWSPVGGSSCYAAAARGCSAWRRRVFDVTDPTLAQPVHRSGGPCMGEPRMCFQQRRSQPGAATCLTLDRADWDLSFAVNVDALFHLCRAALRS